MSKVTIKDVAREAGVSISTVSNALNGVDVLHPDTKEHVLKVAKRLNYIPNLNGKNLKSSATKVIGLFITSLKGPYYDQLVDAISKECEKFGYELNIFITKNDRTALSNILGKRVDGAIISNEFIDEMDVLALEKAEIPIVFIDRERVSKTSASVVFDSYKGGQDVARYLINLGHKNIGYIRGYDHLYDDIERYAGFRATLEEAGIGFNEENLLVGYFEEDASFSAVKAFVKSGKELPDAIVAANDLSAIGCIKALKSEGILVPKDISIISFDNIDLSEYFSPPLTTVNNPIIRLGKLTVESLLGIIQGKTEGKLEKLQGSLVVRDSCSLNKNVLIR
ncbi:LacI family transcriptional regulator [Caldibacillus lycopersici]|uniref:LacI family transcriptional regulator n=1 Tax=Perspicuibacillus lycopersici TaxID=1325689 RepID=A0AAE3IRF2_9BACI|nr:LacI family transcriptional regulator [Perspicuibacillus lycopersici]